MSDQQPRIPTGGVIMVTRADLFPANYGAAIKIDQTALALSRLGCPVRIVTDERRLYYLYSDGRRTPHAFPGWLRIGPWSRLMRQRLRLKGIPPDEAFLYLPLLDWNLSMRAHYVALRSGARIFQAEFPGHCLPCIRMRRRLGGCVLLAEHNVEFARVTTQQANLAPRVSSFLKKVEIGLCNQADRVVTVSDLDRQSLISAGVDASRTVVIPIGVDVPAFDEPPLPGNVLRDFGIEPGTPVLVYHGTFRYPPNLQAMRTLAGEILPRLNKLGIRAKVLAVGAAPPSAPLHPDVIFTGPVDRVAPYIKAASIAVVPLDRGGGTRMKILDYLAASIPVVSTSKGAEGLGLTDGDQVLIRDGHADFSEAVAELLLDPEKARRVAERGREHVVRFDWSQIARAYLSLYSACRPPGTQEP